MWCEFFGVDVCMCVCACVCVGAFVCPLPRLLIISGMIWTPYDWLNKFYSCYMAVVIIIGDGRGLIVLKRIIETNLIRVSRPYLFEKLLLGPLYSATIPFISFGNQLQFQIEATVPAA